MSSETVQGKRTAPDPASVRRARKFLSVLAALFILVALYLQFESPGVLDYAAVGVGALGVVLVGLAL